jgi:hypothetical protein
LVYVQLGDILILIRFDNKLFKILVLVLISSLFIMIRLDNKLFDPSFNDNNKFRSLSNYFKNVVSEIFFIRKKLRLQRYILIIYFFIFI